MISSRAMGIVFPNLHEAGISELVAHRTMGSVPFAGRYRMIDFCLSGMANAGIQNIGILARQNFQSLMDHLGNGREWDLSRKRGGLIIYPPYARDGSKLYRGRVEALASMMDSLEHAREELVVMSDCELASNLDYKQLISAHNQSGADITVVYEKGAVSESLQKDNVALVLAEDGRVREMRINEYKKGIHNLSMNVYVVGREFLINLVKEAMVHGDKRFEEDYLARSLKLVRVHGYEFSGYRSRICDMRSYFTESMRLLNADNLARLFPTENPVYTKVRDEAPVRYAIGSRAVNSLVADGCIIEGEVENSVIFRSVRIGKGAKVKNCIIMQGSEIEAGALMENVITDKNVRVAEGQKLRGAASFPVFIAKGSTVV